MCYYHRKRQLTKKYDTLGKEFEVPVPWGHIKGLQYSSSSSSLPWLGLHGWLDNCGTFSSLAPLLTAQLKSSLFCIDLPGHGRSSHLPPGCFYHHLEGLQHILRVANGLKWRKFNIIGHSMGAGMGLILAALCPDRVNALIALDALKPMSRTEDQLVSKTRSSLGKFMEIEAKMRDGKPPSYTYEKARKRALEGNARIHDGEALKMESIDALLKRGLVENTQGSFHFSRDLRQMVPSLYGYSNEVLKTFAKEVKCPHLIVKAKGWRPYELNEIEVQQEFLNLFKENNDKFEFVEVEGNHHVHLEEPQRVLPLIVDFAKKHQLVPDE